MLGQPIGWLESGALSKDQLCNIQYRDFMRSPLGVMERIYAQFGIEMTATGHASMQKYMDEHPRSRRPSHQYDLGCAERVKQERELFRRYQEYFTVPSET